MTAIRVNERFLSLSNQLAAIAYVTLWLLASIVARFRHSGCQLFGKRHCRFDEAIVRLYKPTASLVEIEQATNLVWPPAGKRSSRRTFRQIPPSTTYHQHPVIVTLGETLRLQNYSDKTAKNYTQALSALLAYVGNTPLKTMTKAAYQKYLLFLIEKRRYSAAILNVHINA